MPGPTVRRSLPHRAARQASIQLASTRAGVSARRAARRRPLVVGPWLAEVGFELLYWIPFLRGLLSGADDVTVISRGGVAAWYDGLADRYVDAYELMAPDELHAEQERRIAAAGGQKHNELTSLDRELLRRAGWSAGTPLLHPSLMFRRFRPVWMRRRPLSMVLRGASYAPLPPLPRPAGLPDRYVAVKAYFSDVFPDEPANRAWLSDLVERLLAAGSVVLLRHGDAVDDHTELELAARPGLVDTSTLGPVAANLGLQTACAAHADTLWCTYGGFAYLGPLVGRPVTSWYSHDLANPQHVEVLRALEQRVDAPHPVRILTCTEAIAGAVEALASPVPHPDRRTD